MFVGARDGFELRQIKRPIPIGLDEMNAHVHLTCVVGYWHVIRNRNDSLRHPILGAKWHSYSN
jgi:hypothetical protein